SWVAPRMQRPSHSRDGRFCFRPNASNLTSHRRHNLERRETMTDQTRFLLSESDLPKYWYNINADNPVPPTPVLHPGTLEPVTPDFLSVLFPMDLILQEISTERYIEIPEEVRA